MYNKTQQKAESSVNLKTNKQDPDFAISDGLSEVEYTKWGLYKIERKIVFFLNLELCCEGVLFTV